MPVRRDKRTGAWIFQSTIKLADGLAALPRRSLWVASEPDRLCVTYDRMIGSVHAIYDRAEGAALLRNGDGSQDPASCTSEADGSSDVQTTLRDDVNKDDKREAIAAVFGAPASAVQARCKPGASQRSSLNRFRFT